MEENGLEHNGLMVLQCLQSHMPSLPVSGFKHPQLLGKKACLGQSPVIGQSVCSPHAMQVLGGAYFQDEWRPPGIQNSIKAGAGLSSLWLLRALRR